MSISVLVMGFYKVGKMFEKEDSEKMVPYIGVLAAVVFAFQFVNYPVPGGTSGHLIGGTMVAIILGPWAAVIVLFLVLVVQSLFGDGGITALGANTFNMGIICGILGFYIVKLIIVGLNKTKLSKPLKVTLASAIGSYIAIVLAAFACGVEIGLGGIIPMNVAVPSMVYWHMLIGIGEAIITGLIIFYIYKAKPDLIMTEKQLGVKPVKPEIIKTEKQVGVV